VTADGGRSPELLAVAGHSATVEPLVAMFGQAGMQVDVCTSLLETLRCFMARGGHDALIVAPDTPPGLALQATTRLRAVDSGLIVIVYGRELLRDVPRVHRLADLHPGARAGMFGVLRLLRELAR
jgi:hypothetical protein